MAARGGRNLGEGRGAYQWARQHVGMEPACMLYTCAVGLASTVHTDLVYRKICSQHYPGNTTCQHLTEPSNRAALDRVQDLSSDWITYQLLAQMIPSFFTAFLFGSWSDHSGRKLPGAVAAAGQSLVALGYLFLTFPGTPLWVVVPLMAMGGISGGFTVFLMVSFSAATDLCTAETRTQRLAYVEGALLVGALLGNGLSAVVIGDRSLPWLPLALEQLLFALAMFYTLAWIPGGPPGSHANGTPGMPAAENTSDAPFFESISSHLADCFRTTFKWRHGNRRAYILLSNCAIFLAGIPILAEMTLLMIYALGEPLEMTAQHYTILKTLTTLLDAGTLFFLLPLLKRRLRASDTALGLLGVVSVVAGMLLVSLARTPILLLCGLVIKSCFIFIFAALQSLLSEVAGPKEQGKIFAFAAAAKSGTAVVFMPAVSALYKRLVDAGLENWTFSISTAPLVICAAIILYIQVDKKRQDADVMRPLVEASQSLNP